MLDYRSSLSATSSTLIIFIHFMWHIAVKISAKELRLFIVSELKYGHFRNSLITLRVSVFWQIRSVK